MDDSYELEIPVGKRSRRYRFFEILPGLTSWLVILLPVVLSFINPTMAAYFVIAFMSWWLLRAISLAIRVLQGYRKLQRYLAVDWKQKLENLEDLDHSLHHYKERDNLSQMDEWHYEHMLEIAGFENPPKPSQLYHAVFVAVYNESKEVIEPTIKSVIDSQYDLKKLILIVAYEERGGAEVEQTVKELVEKHGPVFYHAMAIKHPDGLKNEVIGKGPNITYAGFKLEKYLEQEGIDYRDVIVTTLDADNRTHPSYFAHLTYMYIATEDRKYKSFQPIPMYTNNVWDAPAASRVLATGSSFWWIIQSVRPHLLRNFSAHAQPMEALVDTNYWSCRTIVEDGHQFWRTYFRYNGRHDAVPLFVTIFQDAVLAVSWRKTMKAQFIQLRRWAYGASDIAYFAANAFNGKSKIPLFDRISKFMRLMEAHVSWATVPLILAFAAWTPILVNPEGRDSIIAHQLPLIASRLNTALVSGILVTAYLSLKILPPRPPRYRAHRRAMMALQWALIPFTSIIFGAVAALYSQTRLMLGRYLEVFDVTVKEVKK
ncbi:MAG: hypothetical protein R3313_03220 [Candidatus Saccharimonadales bacterium]|nr:hypothetical protein [Candidatus Saccharimonadales bacterium]